MTSSRPPPLLAWASTLPQPTGFEKAVSGAAAGALSRLVSAPLDVVKIRMQIQLEPTSRLFHRPPSGSLGKYRGVFQALKLIVREEGLMALWKGNASAELLWGTYAAAQFATFYTFRDIAIRNSGDPTGRSTAATKLIGGALAGVVATTISYPFDLLRTRFASQGEPRQHRSMLSMANGILAESGPRGLWRGLGLALAQYVPRLGAQFSLYEAMKERLCRPPTAVEAAAMGASSGVVAKLLVHPLDVVRKRIQVAGFDRVANFGLGLQYRGALDCTMVIVKGEGFAGLFKGAAPSVVKAIPSGAVMFAVYEIAVARLAARREVEC